MSQEGVPSGGLIPQEGDPVPAPRTASSEPARASQRDGPPTPTYQGSGLPLGSSRPTREETWAAMSAKIRDRLGELAGDVLEWFTEEESSSVENRPRAVVLGTRAFCIAEPRIDSAGRPVYVLNRYEFVPGSHKKIQVEHRPGRDNVAAPKAAAGAKGPLPQPSDLGLSTRDAGQLGNLPPKVQELLQAPFSAKDPVRRCEYWYRGRPHRLDIYMLVLAGRHFVTAAIGTQQVPVGHTVANAHWNLTCHRFAVERVVGT
jgi:hypothetical protein